MSTSAGLAQQTHSVERTTAPAVPVLPDPEWPFWWRILFRFCVAFFAFTTLHLTSGSVPLLRAMWVNRALFTPVRWSKTTVFGAESSLITIAGSLQYLATAVLLAGIVTILWSLVDRSRRHYTRAYDWGRIYLRYGLCGIMLGYGMSKVLPLQFSQPGLWMLIQPLGDLTRMQLLWSFMGTSAAYTIFSGVAETAGALLLLWRRTTMLGALLLVAVLTNVVLLNFAYAVPVKFNATIYLLMALALLIPETGRLLDMFIRNRAVHSPVPEAAPTRPASRRTALVIKTIVVGWLVGSEIPGLYSDYYTYGAGAPLPSHYGIYEVENFVLNGVLVSPSATDSTKWHRLVIGERGTGAIQRQPGGSVARFELSQDSTARTITLTPPDTSNVIRLHYVQEARGLLLAAGRAGKDSVQMRLRATDLSKLRLRQPMR